MVLLADPAETAALQQSLSAWPNASPAYFADVQSKVQAIVDSGQLSLFANAYWGHPAYKLPPAVNLLGVAHYLEALDWQALATRIHVILGGKNPHPNLVVGGVPYPIDLNSDAALNVERLSIISNTIGATPLVRLNRISEGIDARIFAKLEFFNPLGSVKDRIAASMIEAAEVERRIDSQTLIVEPTSGNTGIALAALANAQDVPIEIAVPEGVPEEKKAQLRFLGAEVIEVEDELCPIYPSEGARVLPVLDAVRSEVAVIDPPPYNRLPHSFSHIFAGGYAAG